MTEYNAIAEIDIRPTPRRAEAWLDALAEHSPAVGLSERGTTEIVITLHEDLFEVAVTRALALLRNATGQLYSLTVMPTSEWDRRVEQQELNLDLIDTQEAARILDVTRQRMQQLAAAGSVPNVKIGNSLAFPRAAIDRLARVAATTKRGDAGPISIPAGAEPFRPEEAP